MSCLLGCHRWNAPFIYLLCGSLIATSSATQYIFFYMFCPSSPSGSIPPSFNVYIFFVLHPMCSPPQSLISFFNQPLSFLISPPLFSLLYIHASLISPCSPAVYIIDGPSLTCLLYLKGNQSTEDNINTELKVQLWLTHSPLAALSQDRIVIVMTYLDLNENYFSLMQQT